jgi:NRPS condensation-like uncharacterized protein
MAEEAFDPIKSWFVAAEAVGEFIGIRFGRIRPGGSEPEWIYRPHTDYDGIGGFADILRERGEPIPKLPHIKHPTNPSWFPLIKSLPKLLKPRNKLAWNIPTDKTMHSTSSEAPPAVAWHVFDETETIQIRRACRKGGFTVNSFLLKHVSKAIRGYLKNEAAVIPWMAPVNLRGKVFRDRDTANYSAYVGVKIASFETVRDVHRKIYEALGRGEHWANWYAYKTGRVLGHAIKKQMVTSGRCMAEWYLGAFSNLGDWDAEKKINESACLGSWLFTPPVLRCQLVGAGCVTFQNRLSLVIQAHPELTTDVSVARSWMQDWVREIEMDLSSLLSDAAMTPARLAAA